MQHLDGYFKGPRDQEIYHQAWLPEHDVKAVLLIVHGMGEHCGRYMNLVNHFVPKGYAIYSLDHIGHGKSQGKREFVESFEDFTLTLRHYHDMIKTWQPGKPLVLLGHSMGGTIALTYLLEHQQEFDGAIISSPALKPYGKVSSVTIFGGKILSRLLPMTGVLALDLNAISRDPQVVTDYQNDPLTFKGKTPARLAAEMIGAMARIENEAAVIQLPFLVVQGSSDTIVDPSGAQMIYDRAGSTDKTIKIYDGLFHEVFNEPEKEQVLNDVDVWLKSHI